MKKKFILLSTSLLIVSPTFLTISCVSNKYNAEDTANVFAAFNRNQIIVSANKTGHLKINEFNKINFSFKINDSVIDEKNNPEYYKNLKTSLEKSKIEFVDFIIPKLNDDVNSYIIFKINNDVNSTIKIKINSILINSPNLILDNLTAQEIKNTIQNKLNENKDFISDLKILINYNFFEKYKEYSSNVNNNPIETIEQYWINNGIDKILEQKIIEFINKNFNCFENSLYQNIFITNLTLNVVEKNVLISFNITTTLDNNETYYLVPINFINN